LICGNAKARQALVHGRDGHLGEMDGVAASLAPSLKKAR